MATSHRVSRIRGALLREFSDIVQRLRDPRIRFVTVVDAEISSDLRHAKMFISVLGSEEEQTAATAALQKAAGYIRREVAHRIDLRYAPEVTVLYDDTSARAARLTSLIEGLGVEPEAPNGNGAADRAGESRSEVDGPQG
ncbi:30S ribosome-binding factor RbfA [Candidatus Latescibacterota bacterium]